ncbi:hypothetical protein GCM10027047_08410 [Rhodococcus aerolatus]
MAQDIVAVELGLTEGDLVTLWAPRWREDGEEWEAFLGHGDDLYCFDEVAELAAFIRTVDVHDLTDHPAWAAVTGLSAPELEPDDDHRYDLVGLPELAAGEPEGWALAELADSLDVVRSLADVCDLTDVLEILDSAPGLDRLAAGPAAFVGKEGAALWDELGAVLAEKWDTVLDALDDVVFIPEVDEAALTTARAEVADAAAQPDADDDATDDTGDDTEGDDTDERDSDVTAAGDEEPEGFWAEVGIDPIKVITSTDEYVTLRCYLGDTPVFLGSDGRIDVFGSERALARHLADATDHDLAEVVTFPEVAQAATAGELEVEVTADNTYVLPGLADDIEAGPAAIDRLQLELAVELLTDAADAADDDSVSTALAGSQPLGWLVTYVLEPDPTRLEPSPPFAAEAQSWRELETAFEARLRTR